MGDVVKGTIPGWLGGGGFTGEVTKIDEKRNVYTIRFITKPKNYANRHANISKEDINCILNRKQYEREYDELK